MDNTLNFEVVVPLLKHKMNVFLRTFESILVKLHRSEPNVDLSITIKNISHQIYFDEIHAQVDELVNEGVAVYPQNQDLNVDIIDNEKKNHNYENYFSDSMESLNFSNQNHFNRIPVQCQQPIYHLISSDKQLQENLKVRLREKLNILPQLEFTESTIIIVTKEQDLNEEIESCVDQFLSGIKYQSVVLDTPQNASNTALYREFKNKYIQWIESKSISLMFKNVNKQLFAYAFNQKDQQSLFLIKSLTIRMKSFRESEVRAVLFNLFLPRFKDWCQKVSLVQMFCETDSFNEIKQLVLIGPKEEINLMENILDFEAQKVDFSIITMFINAIPKDEYDILSSDMKQFILQSQYISYLKDQNSDLQLLQTRFQQSNKQAELEDLYKNYLYDYNSMQFSFFFYQDRKFEDTCFSTNNSHIRKLFMDKLNQELRSNSSQQFLILGVISKNSHLKEEMKRQFEQACQLECESIYDEKLIQFYNKVDFSLLDSLQEQNWTKMELNNQIMIKGKKHNISRCKHQLYQLLEQKSQVVDYFDFETILNLNVVKHSFQDKFRQLEADYETQLKLDDKPRIKIQTYNSKIHKLREELDYIKHTVEKNIQETNLHLQDQNLKEIVIDDYRIQELEQTYGTQIIFQKNNDSFFQVHASYVHMDTKIRILTGSPAEVLEKDPSILKGYAIILPVVARSTTLPYNLQKKLVSFCRCEDLLKEINDEALGKLKQKRDLFKFKLFEMTKKESEELQGEIYYKEKKKKKQTKKIAIYSNGIYLASYEKEKEKSNFFNYFDKMTLERAIRMIIEDVKESSLMVFLTDDDNPGLFNEIVRSIRENNKKIEVGVTLQIDLLIESGLAGERPGADQRAGQLLEGHRIGRGTVGKTEPGRGDGGAVQGNHHGGQEEEGGGSEADQAVAADRQRVDRDHSREEGVHSLNQAGVHVGRLPEDDQCQIDEFVFVHDLIRQHDQEITIYGRLKEVPRQKYVDEGWFIRNLYHPLEEEHLNKIKDNSLSDLKKYKLFYSRAMVLTNDTQVFTMNLQREDAPCDQFHLQLTKLNHHLGRRQQICIRGFEASSIQECGQRVLEYCKTAKKKFEKKLYFSDQILHRLRAKLTPDFEFRQNYINIQKHNELELKDTVAKLQAEVQAIMNDIPYPSDWQPQAQNITIFQIDKKSEEFRTISDIIQDTIENQQDVIHYIERIQNQDLYYKYHYEQQRLEKIKNISNGNERLLFYGSELLSPNNIVWKKEYSQEVQQMMKDEAIVFFDSAFYTYQNLAHLNCRYQKQIMVFRVLLGTEQDREKGSKLNEKNDDDYYDSICKKFHYLDSEVRKYEVFEFEKVYPQYIVTFEKGSE